MPYVQNKRTGEWWEADAQGRPLRPVNAQPSLPSRPTVSATPLPASPQQVRDNARQDRKDADDRAQRTQDYALRRKQFLADLAKDGKTLDQNDNIVDIPGWKPRLTPEQEKDLSARSTALASLVKQINRTQELGNQGPLATRGLSGLLDYNPFSSANVGFDTAGAQLSQQGLAAFRVPGTGTVSDRDAIMFDRGNLPQAGNLDARNAEILNGLRSRVETEYGALGIPAPEWVSPLNKGSEDGAPKIVASRGSVKNAITGNTRARFDVDADMSAQVRNAWLGGASFDQLNKMLSQSGYRQITPGEWNSIETWRKKGRGKEVEWSVGREVPLSRLEELSGSGTGAGLAGVANAGSFGAVQGLAPEAYANVQAMNPGVNLGGEVLGAIGGTSLLGNLGSKAAYKLGDYGRRLVQGGGRAGNWARGVGTDALYSGIYGANTGQGFGSGAVQGGAGSVGGRVIGGVAGRAIGGLTKNADAAYLNSVGIPTTVGQNMGGIFNRIEDRAMSLPVVGDLIAARRLDGFNGFRDAARNQAGKPIGATFNDGGESWMAQLPSEFNDAYTNATKGVTVPLDSTLLADVAKARAAGGSLPSDLSAKFDLAVKNRVNPILQSGQLTGEGYQQSFRGLKGYKSEATKPGFEEEYRNALTAMQDALTGQMNRGGGQSVTTGLKNADQAYRMAKTLQTAERNAVNGTRTGEPGLFAPSQLNTADVASMKKFGGNRAFGELTDAAQRILPSKIPDPGTAGRLMQLGLPAAVVGTGAGAGYAAGGAEGVTDGTVAGILTAAMLSAGGTRGGQYAINKLLFDRPYLLEAFGSQIRKKKGLLGAAAAPLVIESGN